MKLVKITPKNIELLSKFLENAGNSLNQFRYFNSRDFSVLSNHLVTYILVVNNEPIGYGHLDKDGSTVWLGISISEKKTGMGYGKTLMEKILTFADKEKIGKITLSVDSDNFSARNLYERFGFFLTKESNKVCYYLRVSNHK